MPAATTQTVKPATETDLRHLREFAAVIAADTFVDRTRFEPNAPCRFGKRLVELGWAVTYSYAGTSTRGFCSGGYHAAQYCLTPAGRVAANAGANI